MKSLLIARHCKSDRSADALVQDRIRPLNPRGLQDAPRLGKALNHYEWLPHLVISSPAVRAHYTARLVMQAAGYTGEILTNEKLYSGGTTGFLECIRETDSSISSLACFGHNPVIAELIQYLTGSHQYPVTPTGTMALLQFHTQDWSRIGSAPAELVFLLIPRLLV